MAHTYRATGINLKGMPLGESDRLMTILTREQGLIRAVAKGARKQPSKLGGRMELFVVNELVLSGGRWSSAQDPQAQLQRITQAETIQSFSRLGHSLAQLTAAQYLGEVALMQALAGEAQEELFVLLLEHLSRLERADSAQAVLPLLTHGLYHLLALGGIAPQSQYCHYCRQAVSNDLGTDPSHEDVYFSFSAGGVLCEACSIAQRPQRLSVLSAAVLRILQTLPLPTLGSDPGGMALGWSGVEMLLRRTIEYHHERPVRSAQLLDGQTLMSVVQPSKA